MHLQIYSFSGRKILHWFWPLDSLARTISGFIGFKIDKAGLPVQMWNNYLHSLATSGCDELSVHIPFLSQLVLDAAICSFIFPHFPMQHAMPMSKVLAFWHSLPLHIQQGFSTNEDLSQFQTFQGAWWKEKAFSNLNPFWNSTWRQLDWPSSVVWYFAHAHALIKKGYVNVCRSSGPIVALKNLRTVAYWHVLCPKMNRLRLCGQTASRGYIIVGLPKPCAASFSGLLIDSQVCIGHLLTHPSSVTDLTSAGP